MSKALKEAFVTGHTGSSVFEIAVVVSTFFTAQLLRCICLQPHHSKTAASFLTELGTLGATVAACCGANIALWLLLASAVGAAVHTLKLFQTGSQGADVRAGMLQRWQERWCAAVDTLHAASIGCATAAVAGGFHAVCWLNSTSQYTQSGRKAEAASRDPVCGSTPRESCLSCAFSFLSVFGT